MKTSRLMGCFGSRDDRISSRQRHCPGRYIRSVSGEFGAGSKNASIPQPLLGSQPTMRLPSYNSSKATSQNGSALYRTDLLQHLPRLRLSPRRNGSAWLTIIPFYSYIAVALLRVHALRMIIRSHRRPYIWSVQIQRRPSASCTGSSTSANRSVTRGARCTFYSWPA